MLGLVRGKQPISRADLARLSGLQRSTVSLIVEELISAGWITEGATGRLPRGRRPTFLRLNESRVLIGVDIRPTSTTLALADVNARVLSHEVFPTPKSPKQAVSDLASRIRKLMRANPGLGFEGIGISVSGRVDPATRRLSFAPNLHWKDCDLAAPLARATALDVEVENAANACALAHVWFSGDPAGDLIAITVAEGVGAGLFLNGKLIRGVAGLSGEFGHTTLDPNGPECACGNRGCWEVFASNTAAVRYYLDGGDPSAGPTFQDLLALAAQGDPRAVAALDRMAAYLGRGAATLVTGLAPASLVFVGDLTRAWKRFAPAIEREIRARCLTPYTVRLIAADDGSTARLRGAFALILQKRFGLPSPIALRA